MTWWKSSVIYQIYPRSFQDSNGDGIGDLRGIIQRLDYLKSLGVDILWLSPVYQSPNDDNGYDISDYRAIHPEFGTMADFDELLEETHKRSMKLVMDLVVNHSSDEHSWFQASRKSPDSPYRDWYIWRRPSPAGGPPNNWESFFGGSAWEYDNVSGEYYLHLFTKKQPDLNWENPQVRQAVYDIMRYWLDKGVDGFRMDVISLISKPEGLPDVENPKESAQAYSNGPRLHEFLQEMHREVIQHYDIVTIGETPGITTENAWLYVGSDRKELNMAFQFDLMDIDWGETRFDIQEWQPKEFFDIFIRWDKALSEKGWNNIFLGNHDFPRIVSRFGDDKHYRTESAKLLATFMLSMRGTPTIYQGEEIGTPNTRFDSIEEHDDIWTHNLYALHVNAGGEPGAFLEAANFAARDHARTPVSWDSSEGAGFTTGKPWIKLNTQHQEINVANAEKNPDSVLHFYRELLKLRKAHPVFAFGDFDVIDAGNDKVFAYRRSYDGSSVEVWLNFSSETQHCHMPEPDHLLIGNYASPEAAVLRPWEGIIRLLA
ncbi:MAG: alpha-glucosidase [Bacteroidia bacterium]